MTRSKDLLGACWQREAGAFVEGENQDTGTERLWWCRLGVDLRG